MKKAVSVAFVCILCALFVGTFCAGYSRDMRNVFLGYGGGIKGLILTATDRDTQDERLNEDMILKYNWIDLFGAALRVTGVNSLREDDGKHIVRLKDDRLAFVRSLRSPSAQQTAWMRSMYETAQAAGSSCLYVSIPQKTCPDQTQYCARGAANRSEITDAVYTEAFGTAGFRVLDLHARMHADGMGHTQLYYKTDHHWTGNTALWAAGVLAQEIGVSAETIRPELFQTQTYPNAFLGSEGKHVGRLYCGTDIFSVPIPQFDTHLTLTFDADQPERTGSFAETILFAEYLTAGPFQSSMYGAFLGGDRGWVRIHNDLMPQGKRVLLVKDSFSNSMAPYLALTCGQIDMIDLRHYSESGIQLVRQGGYDAVIVATTYLSAEVTE